VQGTEEQERRRHRRLPAAFPVRFTGRTPAGTAVLGRGLTLDVSSGGLRFETDAAEPPVPQTEVALHILVPRSPESGETRVFVSARATVVRCEPVDAASRRHTGARWSLAARFSDPPGISLPVPEDFVPGHLPTER
jgi:hypothetical protein